MAGRTGQVSLDIFSVYFLSSYSFSDWDIITLMSYGVSLVQMLTRSGQGRSPMGYATSKVVRVGDPIEFLKRVSRLLLGVLNVLVLRCMMHDLLSVVCRTWVHDLYNGALFSQMLREVSALFQRSSTQSTLDF